jgi:hypothetical protein
MIAAIDTEGDIYWSLMDTNTNNRTMGMFLKFLIEKLDDDRPGWRLDTCLKFDGASYHKSPPTIKLLDQLQVPYIISSPYSYDCSCIELFFARLKDRDLNPLNLRTSKSKLEHLVLIS